MGKLRLFTGAGKKGEVDGTGYATLNALREKRVAKVTVSATSLLRTPTPRLQRLRQKVVKQVVFIGDVSTEETCAGMVESRRRKLWQSERTLQQRRVWRRRDGHAGGRSEVGQSHAMSISKV